MGGIGYIIVRGTKALWDHHVRRIEKRVNEKKKTDVENFLQGLSEEEKKKLKEQVQSLVL